MTGNMNLRLRSILILFIYSLSLLGSTSQKVFLYVESGGSRMSMAICFLAELEKSTGKRITESIDYFGGASMGSIFATILNFKYPVTGKPKYSATDICENYNDRVFYEILATKLDFLNYVEQNRSYYNQGNHDLLCDETFRSKADLDFSQKINSISTNM